MKVVHHHHYLYYHLNNHFVLHHKDYQIKMPLFELCDDNVLSDIINVGNGSSIIAGGYAW